MHSHGHGENVKAGKKRETLLKKPSQSAHFYSALDCVFVLHTHPRRYRIHISEICPSPLPAFSLSVSLSLTHTLLNFLIISTPPPYICPQAAHKGHLYLKRKNTISPKSFQLDYYIRLQRRQKALGQIGSVNSNVLEFI